MGGGLRRAGLLMGRVTQRVAARSRCPAVEEQAKGLVSSLQAAALLVGPPWVVANDVGSNWWWGNWELVLLVAGEHAGGMPMVRVLVLLVCR